MAKLSPGIKKIVETFRRYSFLNEKLEYFQRLLPMINNIIYKIYFTSTRLRALDLIFLICPMIILTAIGVHMLFSIATVATSNACG